MFCPDCGKEVPAGSKLGILNVTKNLMKPLPVVGNIKVIK